MTAFHINKKYLSQIPALQLLINLGRLDNPFNSAIRFPQLILHIKNRLYLFMDKKYCRQDLILTQGIGLPLYHDHGITSTGNNDIHA